MKEKLKHGNRTLKQTLRTVRAIRKETEALQEQPQSNWHEFGYYLNGKWYKPDRHYKVPLQKIPKIIKCSSLTLIPRNIVGAILVWLIRKTDSIKHRVKISY